MTHNPKVAGSNPAPATKKTLGITTDTKGFLASGFIEVTLHTASIPRAEQFGTVSEPCLTAPVEP